MKSDLVYLEHIRGCLSAIIEYTDEISIAQFMNQRMIQDACIRQFEVMGEATKRISVELRQKYPTIKWKQMAGFRDRLIHDYLHVDLDLVWNASKYTSVSLLIEIEEILTSETKNESINE
ncbi:MAG: DUF86 domain-containing protein [Spirosomaceae bacterium]|jgi:uncharacterized protein with HEPN domain|nr:DUF86 domain-containing protein [Spirosomataceae bacterium]